MDISSEQPDPAEAYVRLISRHKRQFPKHAYVLLGRAADAEDVLHEVKIAIFSTCSASTTRS